MADDKMDVIFTSSVDDCIDDGQFADQSNNMRVFLAMDHDRSTFKFDPGRIIVTTGIIERFIPEAHMGRDKIAPLLARHLAGDWGDVPAEDARANDRDLASQEGRLLSSYQLESAKIWIITEPGVTTILLPEEY